MRLPQFLQQRRLPGPSGLAGCVASLHSYSAPLCVRGKHLPLLKCSPYETEAGHWVSLASIITLFKSLREEVREKPIKPRPDQQGNSMS